MSDYIFRLQFRLFDELKFIQASLSFISECFLGGQRNVETCYSTYDFDMNIRFEFKVEHTQKRNVKRPNCN